MEFGKANNFLKIFFSLRKQKDVFSSLKVIAKKLRELTRGTRNCDRNNFFLITQNTAASRASYLLRLYQCLIVADDLELIAMVAAGCGQCFGSEVGSRSLIICTNPDPS